MTRRPGFAVAAVLACLVLTACGTTPEPEPIPTATGPYPAADITPLTPALPPDTPYQDHPAVQTMRDTSTIIAWANLTNTTHFAQFTQQIDPDSNPGVIDLNPRAAIYEWVALGPNPRLVLSVEENADGTTVVHSCIYTAEEVSKATGEPRDMTGLSRSTLIDTTVSPLTEDEIAELDALGLEAPAMRVRGYQTVTGECDASTATAQQFENWREHAPIGDYDIPNPYDVTIIGEDGQPTTVPREDMP